MQQFLGKSTDKSIFFIGFVLQSSKSCRKPVHSIAVQPNSCFPSVFLSDHITIKQEKKHEVQF